jgi:hypothetical protein
MPDIGSGKPPERLTELSPSLESGFEADQKAFEQSSESQETFLEEEAPTTIARAPSDRPGQPQGVAPTEQAAKDEATLEVEKILEEGLGKLYLSLPESAKPKFKQKGELAAREISAMVRGAKLHFKRALHLIRDWLLTIPHVNRFFLEQEAKIKVDRIRELIETPEEVGKQP